MNVSALPGMQSKNCKRSRSSNWQLCAKGTKFERSEIDKRANYSVRKNVLPSLMSFAW
jgi:hypothetical protein